MDRFSVQIQSNFRGWLHRVFPRKRHQMRHLCEFPRLLAKQVLSQLSYTPTAGTSIDIKVFALVRKLRIFTFYPLLCQNCVKTPFARTLLFQNKRHFVGRQLPPQRPLIRLAWRTFTRFEHELMVLFVLCGLITAVLGIEILEVRGAAFAFLPSFAVAVILLTKMVLLVGTVRAHGLPVEEPLAASKLNLSALSLRLQRNRSAVARGPSEPLDCRICSSLFRRLLFRGKLISSFSDAP